MTRETSRLPAMPEPRWPGRVAMLAVGGIYLALPDSLALGPRWLHMTALVFLLAATVVTHRRGRPDLNQIFGFLLAGFITFFLVWSLVLLVRAVPTHQETPVTMLRSAVALWVANVLVFAYWYWRLDGGGPNGRLSGTGGGSRAFLFPQMTLDEPPGAEPWAPQFVDYLFLAFNTNMAFSPTDTAVLSRTAKILTMIQSSVSLTVVVVLAARAVNIF